MFHKPTCQEYGFLKICSPVINSGEDMAMTICLHSDTKVDKFLA